MFRLEVLLLGRITIILTMFVSAAEAGELRAGFGFSLGGLSFENRAQEEITIDGESAGLGATYFLSDNTGPFVGAGITKQNFNDFELNNQSTNRVIQDSEIYSLSLGFRYGFFYDDQYFVVADYDRFEPEVGSTDESMSYKVGVERSYDVGRYSLAFDYHPGDEIDTYGLGLVGVIYPFEELFKHFGISGSISYQDGDGRFLGSEVDVKSWSVSIGLAYRALSWQSMSF